MKRSKSVIFEEKDIVVRELSIDEIDRVFMTGGQREILDIVFAERIPVLAVEIATGLTRKDFGNASATALAGLWDAVEEMNPFFVQTLQRLANLARVNQSMTGEEK